MLRAKAVKFKKGGATFRDRLLSSTDALGKLATIPVVVQTVNAVNQNPAPRAALMEKVLGVHQERELPRYASARFRSSAPGPTRHCRCATARRTPGKVARFRHLLRQLQRARHRPRPARDACAQRDPGRARRERSLLRHAQARARRPRSGRALKERNIPVLAKLAREGYAILTAVPSCTLMFKQELPLMFPDDADVKAVAEAMFDPFEYLVLRNRDGLLKTDFKHAAGQRLLSRALPPARAEHRAEDARAARAGARHGSHIPSSAARATTAPGA